ncbi:hypothetical protein [uncultured Sphingomonas sp.]|jgi:hypothetical protein|uniref:hypothetical protein n=1 Tax=unclassified Sphingomonas TaxID=196159 RepID=UPI0025E23F48|nr:hypothetical protein [uncultured Sphingomonas sp.]
MNRTLVTTNEAARHPLRRSLPPPAPAKRQAREDDQDLKLFVLSFTAFFVCFYTLIM